MRKCPKCDSKKTVTEVVKETANYYVWKGTCLSCGHVKQGTEDK